MRNWIRISIVLLGLVIGSAFASAQTPTPPPYPVCVPTATTETTNYSLTKPGHCALNWDTTYNTDLDEIDTILHSLSGGSGGSLGYQVAPDSGLTLSIAPGIVACSSRIETYLGGTLTMSDNTTNYVYLAFGPIGTCPLENNTTGFPTDSIPIATVITSGGTISTVTDVRTPFKNSIPLSALTAATGENDIYNGNNPQFWFWQDDNEEPMFLIEESGPSSDPNDPMMEISLLPTSQLLADLKLDRTADGSGPEAALWIAYGMNTGSDPTTGAIYVDAGDISSAPNSLLMNLLAEVDGTPEGQFTVDKLGNVVLTGSLQAAGSKSSSGENCLQTDSVGNITNTGSPCGSGGGGGGGGFTPANGIFAGDSGNDDDSNAIEPTFALSSFTCAAGICTVVNTGTNGLAAGDWVNMRFSSAWTSTFAAPTDITYSTGYTVFKVISTGLSSTQFEFSYSGTGTCASTCGNAAKASYNLPFNTANIAGLKGNLTPYMVMPNPVTLQALNTYYSTILHPLSEAVTGQPTYFIFGQEENDAFASGAGCNSVATIEAALQSLWAKVHTDNSSVVVWSSNAVNVNQGGIGICSSAYQTWIALEQWLPAQGKNATNQASGQYWDYFADVNRVVNDPGNSLLVAGNGGFGPEGVNHAASKIATVLLSGVSDPLDKRSDYFGSGPGVTGVGNGFMYIPTYDSVYTYQWFAAPSGSTLGSQIMSLGTLSGYQHLDVNSDSPSIFNSTSQNTGNHYPSTVAVQEPSSASTAFNYPIFGVIAPSLPTGSAIKEDLGRDNSTNDALRMQFFYAGAGSASNYAIFGLYGANGLKIDGNGNVVLQSVATSPSTSPICPNGTGGALTTSGCSSGASVWGSITGTLSSQTDLQTALNAKAPTASPTLTGTPDASGATQFKLPVASGGASAANGEIIYDSTNKNWHLWANGVDTILLPLPTTFTSGDCGEPTNTGGNWVLADVGGPCGTSGGGAAFSAITAGTNTATLQVGTGGSMTPTGTGLISANELNGVPFCTGFTPTTGQNLQYTTASSPNPCYTAATAASSGAWTNITGTVTASGCTVSSGVCTANASTGTVTFSSIPGTYTHLKIIVDGSGSGQTGRCSFEFRFNGDTGSDYYDNYGEINSGSYTAGGADTGVTSMLVGEVGGTAVPIGGGEVTILNYANTGVQKMVLSPMTYAPSSTSSLTTWQFDGHWNQTSAITSVAIIMGNGSPANWATTSTFSIWGVN